MLCTVRNQYRNLPDMQRLCPHVFRGSAPAGNGQARAYVCIARVKICLVRIRLASDYQTHVGQKILSRAEQVVNAQMNLMASDFKPPEQLRKFGDANSVLHGM